MDAAIAPWRIVFSGAVAGFFFASSIVDSFRSYSITGYSGGGKKLIAEYQNAPSEGIDLNQPRYYGLSLKHKHLPEMRKHAGLETPPIFLPILGNGRLG